MPLFMFWNVGRKNIVTLIAAIATAEDLDVIILAENTETTSETLAALRTVSSDYNFASAGDNRLQIYVKFSVSFVSLLYDANRYTIRGLNLPGRESIILAAVHLPSQLDTSKTGIFVECQQLAAHIEEQEAKLAISRTIVLGDMNLNPFDLGLTAASGLHALMSQELTKKPSRIVQGKSYKKFYNPMWSHFGDSRGDTAGTFYYAKADQDCLFWNMFDQVLLRPELAIGFKHEDLRILSKAGSTQLVRKNGTPNKTLGSDHLPIIIQLRF